MGRQLGVDLRKLDEYDITEGILGVVGDSDARHAVTEQDPLVLIGVPPILGYVHWLVSPGRLVV
jgi:hypothetical protein